MPDIKDVDTSEWGTFKDSLKAPVHRWFTYPAGFSYKAAEYSFNKAGLSGDSTVYDPFMGSGTTNLAAKTMGINSLGVEAHPFVFPIARCKMNWSIDETATRQHLKNLQDLTEQDQISSACKEEIVSREFPELVVKCFLPETLYELMIIRNYIRKISDDNIRLFLNTALICSLRIVSIAATGWPYIAPKKIKITSYSKKGLNSYLEFVDKMFDDLSVVNFIYGGTRSEHRIFQADCRDTTDIITNESVDHIFTSPPYLNNFDYADRTRLEMYFMGDAKNWKDICQKVRTQLITSATTQINRGDDKYQFTHEFANTNPEEYEFLKNVVNQLSELRLHKGGKKSYDLLVIGYFNDLYQVLKDNYRVLKTGGRAEYILGDSAPYGVHIPTDEIIGKIGCNIGFSNCRIELLRTRGDKWKDNPQRHNVHLRETIVSLTK
ncbi:MAG: hypothetical protein J6S43_01805 [Lentisphaeria bacterium]|nr:hypothetical protein [Lentisphaeria bacterium]